MSHVFSCFYYSYITIPSNPWIPSCLQCIYNCTAWIDFGISFSWSRKLSTDMMSFLIKIIRKNDVSYRLKRFITYLDGTKQWPNSVSYTHLDVYKRQVGKLPLPLNRSSPKSKGLESSTIQSHMQKII